ncbi:hypothetical protein [Aeromonas sp. Y311-2]|uniref:hypothetical protein n=1 Tax=Aeromonas sp. Y311-2 TaxID=2990507 RepID=UPI0022E331A1|nr:hypothetical protein [Aeromonas sp. Y311-2]
MMTEIDYLMQLDESGVQLREQEDAMINNVAEWMDTPIGSVYGRPGWGNRFISFKHEPPGEDLEVAIENMIVTDLPRDVRGVVVRGIRCEYNQREIDICSVTIVTNFGTLSTQLNTKEAL